MPFTVFAAQEVIPMGAGNAFPLYRQYLQLLTWQAESRRSLDLTWMLKCPFHLPYLTGDWMSERVDERVGGWVSG